MKDIKVKYPKPGAGKKVAEIFKSTRKKEPSDHLIKIISEIPEVDLNDDSKNNQAAKGLEL